VNETHNLIHVAVLHENKGEVLMEGKTAEMRLRLVAPLHPEIGQDVEKLRQQVEETSNCIVWPALEVRLWEFSEWNPFEIEPDEQDTLHADFLVEKTVKSIQIYYYIHNIEKRKKNLGWALSQYFQVPVNEKQTPHPMNRLSDPRPKNERPDRERPDQQKQQRQQAPQPVQPVARPVRPVQPREPIQAPEKKK
jgi:hypothetical protein